MKQLDPNAVLDPDKYYIALVRSHYHMDDKRYDQAIWTAPMRARSCGSINNPRTTTREILIFIAAFSNDLASNRIDSLELFELPVDPVYTMPTRDENGKLLISRA